jgi:hypothetical protein
MRRRRRRRRSKSLTHIPLKHTTISPHITISRTKHPHPHPWGRVYGIAADAVVSGGQRSSLEGISERRGMGGGGADMGADAVGGGDELAKSQA